MEHEFKKNGQPLPKRLHVAALISFAHPIPMRMTDETMDEFQDSLREWAGAVLKVVDALIDVEQRTNPENQKKKDAR